MVETARELSEVVREAVRPHLGKFASRMLEGQGASGDTTFSIDEVAELRVTEYLDSRPDIAYYTEDRGLVAKGDAEYLFIIDPIDGTRPAAAGLESCCVSVAVAALEGRTPHAMTMGDVTIGVVSEIKSRAVFTAVKGAGAVIEIEGDTVPPALSRTTDLHKLFWTAGYRGRPAEALTSVMAELIDLSSVDGGYFDLGSATYSITRIVTGQMDAYVDVGQRMVEEIPVLRETFLAVGHGFVLNNYPYDLAAAALIAAECGAPVTDAAGRSLDPCPLIPEGGGGQLSSLVSSNNVLHAAVLERLDAGMERLSRRHGPA
jgi:myo-inositol-1(or 4)-monophosphatase